MKTIEEKSKGTNYAHLSVGEMSKLGEYILPFAPGVDIPGKVFVGSALGATGAEMSFQSFAPGSETGFLHTHLTHEELYIFIAGSGEFQVDGEVFAIGEGSVVRVSPKGERAVRNTGTTPLVMICIQYKSSTFTAEDAHDGKLAEAPLHW